MRPGFKSHVVSFFPFKIGLFNAVEGSQFRQTGLLLNLCNAGLTVG